MQPIPEELVPQGIGQQAVDCRAGSVTPQHCSTPDKRYETNVQTYTIAICTRNRDKFLSMCLSGVIAAKGSRNPEIIVVDNASTDQTRNVAEFYGADVLYVHEPRLGLSHARNRALGEAKGDYVVFLDDDAIPEAHWIDGIEEAISSGADVFGGKFTPFYLSEKPAWYLDEFGSAHTELNEGPQPEAVCFSGGNMGWRKNLAQRLGGFDPALGMVGGKLALGEETALQKLIRKNNPGAVFWFSENMSIKHFVPIEKISIRYILKRNFIYGTTIHSIDHNNRLSHTSLLHFILISKLGLPLLYRFFFRDRSACPSWMTYCAHYCTQTGMLAGALYARVERRFSRRFARGRAT